MKIHIRLRPYASGKYWKVERTPHRWQRLSDEEKQNLNAAHTFVNRLNSERAIQCVTSSAE